MKIFIFTKSMLGVRKQIWVDASIMEKNLLENLQLFLRSSKAITRNYFRTKTYPSAELLTAFNIMPTIFNFCF